ncbi:MAG: hypothetical protein M5R36_27800 [Deltaproteobacteria bacterium]|nr:hypothetical protein [Deltaproteobacteria bacterium]
MRYAFMWMFVVATVSFFSSLVAAQPMDWSDFDDYVDAELEEGINWGVVWQGEYDFGDLASSILGGIYGNRGQSPIYRVQI